MHKRFRNDIVYETSNVEMFETDGKRNEFKQAEHTLEAKMIVEHDLKLTLEQLVVYLFGENVKYRIGIIFISKANWSVIKRHPFLGENRKSTS